MHWRLKTLQRTPGKSSRTTLPCDFQMCHGDSCGPAYLPGDHSLQLRYTYLSLFPFHGIAAEFNTHYSITRSSLGTLLLRLCRAHATMSLCRASCFCFFLSQTLLRGDESNSQELQRWVPGSSFSFRWCMLVPQKPRRPGSGMQWIPNSMDELVSCIKQHVHSCIPHRSSWTVSCILHPVHSI